MVEKRGNYWCVIHGHEQKSGSETDKPKGAVIYCYAIKHYGDAGAKQKAERMHKAILISQTKGKGA